MFSVILAKELAFVIVGIAISAIVIEKKTIPCDSCKYLVRKGGAWKYTCKKPDRYFDDTFDKVPTYCKDYKLRESE